MTPPAYTWSYVLGIAREHKRALVIAHLVALFAAAASVPIPLLLPLLVDEVLLNKPGALTHAINALTPANWHTPLLYIGGVLVATLLLRLMSMLAGVWQSREFTLIAKDVTYRLRRQMLNRLGRIAMVEYETLGSGTVASHFVTDLNALDDFIGAAVAKFVVAVLSDRKSVV